MVSRGFLATQLRQQCQQLDHLRLRLVILKGDPIDERNDGQDWIDEVRAVQQNRPRFKLDIDELRYCFVDRVKGIRYVELLSREVRVALAEELEWR